MNFKAMGEQLLAAQRRADDQETAMLMHEDEFGCPAMPRVMERSAWEQEHRPHLKGKAFSEEPFPHPSGSWVSSVCCCGAKHVRDTADDKPFTYGISINDDPRR